MKKVPEINAAWRRDVQTLVEENSPNLKNLANSPVDHRCKRYGFVQPLYLPYPFDDSEPPELALQHCSTKHRDLRASDTLNIPKSKSLALKGSVRSYWGRLVSSKVKHLKDLQDPTSY